MVLSASLDGRHESLLKRGTTIVMVKHVLQWAGLVTSSTADPRFIAALFHWTETTVV